MIELRRWVWPQAAARDGNHGLCSDDAHPPTTTVPPGEPLHLRPAGSGEAASTHDQTNDEHFMRMALQHAVMAARVGEVPVGAVLVAADGATVLGAAHNQVDGGALRRREGRDLKGGGSLAISVRGVAAIHRHSI
jgi:hypothetical protein